jgi:hypothetical protein
MKKLKPVFPDHTKKTSEPIKNYWFNLELYWKALLHWTFFLNQNPRCHSSDEIKKLKPVFSDHTKKRLKSSRIIGLTCNCIERLYYTWLSFWTSRESDVMCWSEEQWFISSQVLKLALLGTINVSCQYLHVGKRSGTPLPLQSAKKRAKTGWWRFFNL